MFGQMYCKRGKYWDRRDSKEVNLLITMKGPSCTIIFISCRTGVSSHDGVSPTISRLTSVPNIFILILCQVKIPVQQARKCLALHDLQKFQVRKAHPCCSLDMLLDSLCNYGLIKLGAEGKRLASKNVWVSLLKTIAYWRAECYCSTRFFFPLHLAQASSGGNRELLCFRWHT